MYQNSCQETDDFLANWIFWPTSDFDNLITLHESTMTNVDPCATLPGENLYNVIHLIKSSKTTSNENSNEKFSNVLFF